MRSDLIFQSQFCACLILGPACNCHAVHYIPHHHGLWNSLSLATLLIHKIRRGRKTVCTAPSLWILSSIVLLWGCPLGTRWYAASQAPPRARVTELAGKSDAQVILTHIIIWPPARVVQRHRTSQWPRLSSSQKTNEVWKMSVAKKQHCQKKPYSISPPRQVWRIQPTVLPWSKLSFTMTFLNQKATGKHL